MISALNFKIGGGGGACADASVENSDASYIASVASGNTLILPDIMVTDSDGTSYSAPSVTGIVCTPAAAATVRNSDLSYNTTVASGGTLTLPDITLTDGDGTTSTKPSAVNVYCKPFPVGATLMKTGQTTSYRTGDDGDIEAGRATSFTTLASRNPFSNFNRFTSIAGTQTYTNNIVIDWSTYNGTNVLGYYRVVSGSDVNWNSAIDAALALSVSTFTSGWRLPNKREMENIFNYSLSFGISYAPFSFPNNTIWTSTTYEASTTVAYTHAGSWINLTSKTSAARWIAVRTFTVTGTTLS